MPSNERIDLSDFLARFNVTEEDVMALERVRSLDRLSPAEYLEFLERFAAAHPPTRDIPGRHEPFVL